jgi:hypothetical protein
MLAALAPSDVVTVTRIDRLARSTFDLFAIVKQIVDAEAQFRSLAEPWADSGTSTGRLMIAMLSGWQLRACGRPARPSGTTNGPILTSAALLSISGLARKRCEVGQRWRTLGRYSLSDNQ